MKKKNLPFDRAMELRRRPGTRLVHMHGGTQGFYVVRGGPVEPAVANRIIAHPLVRGGKDDLFPGHDQTWRMIDETRP
jgi:hypothetical protein